MTNTTLTINIYHVRLSRGDRIELEVNGEVLAGALTLTPPISISYIKNQLIERITSELVLEKYAHQVSVVDYFPPEVTLTLLATLTLESSTVYETLPPILLDLMQDLPNTFPELLL
jgi:hypothetical protein